MPHVSICFRFSSLCLWKKKPKFWTIESIVIPRNSVCFAERSSHQVLFLSLKMHWKTQLCWHRFFSLFEKFKWRRSMQFILLNTQLSYSWLYWTSYIYARKSLFYQLLYFFLKTSLDYHMNAIITRSWLETAFEY